MTNEIHDALVALGWTPPDSGAPVKRADSINVQTPRDMLKAIRAIKQRIKRTKAKHAELIEELNNRKELSLMFAPVKVGDKVPLDRGGSGEVQGVKFERIDGDRLLYKALVNDKVMKFVTVVK